MSDFPNFGVNVTNDLKTKRVVVRREAYILNQSRVPIYITNATGSFQGTFQGDGSLLTGVVASGVGITTLDDSVIVATVESISFDDHLSVTAASGTASIVVETGSMVVSSSNSSLTASLALSIPVYTGSVDEGDVSYSGSFTGSFRGTGVSTILDTTNSTSTGSGALVINGGLGVGLDVFVGGSVTELSDVSIKENIQNIDNALDTVLKLRGVKYNTANNSNTELGFIAQEVQAVLPEAVVTGDLYGVKYTKIVTILTEAIKEQQQQINELSEKLKLLGG